jgi:hypothetical protein
MRAADGNALGGDAAPRLTASVGLCLERYEAAVTVSLVDVVHPGV